MTEASCSLRGSGNQPPMFLYPGWKKMLPESPSGEFQISRHIVQISCETAMHFVDTQSIYPYKRPNHRLASKEDFGNLVDHSCDQNRRDPGGKPPKAEP